MSVGAPTSDLFKQDTGVCMDDLSFNLILRFSQIFSRKYLLLYTFKLYL